MRLKSLAVIPARGGSSRLENKNIHSLGGKPLIRWITEAVIASDRFDHILISTDSDEIFDAVADLNVARHERPKHLATVKSTVLDAMMDLRKDYDKFDFRVFAFFLPTCPFISSEDIVTGIDILNESVYPKPPRTPGKLAEKVDSVISMTEFKDTVQLACVMKGHDVVPIFDNLEHGLTNSKFLKKYYKPSGAFYLADWNHLMEHENFFKGNVKGVLIPEERSVDINNIYDVQYAESLLSKKNDTSI